MSTVAPAHKKSAATSEGTLRGLWMLSINKYPILEGLLESFEVAYQTHFAEHASLFFGSVNTKGPAITDLALQDGEVHEVSGDGEVVVSFKITYDGVVYEFKEGKRRPANPSEIVGGLVTSGGAGGSGEDGSGSGEDGSWSAQAVGR